MRKRILLLAPTHRDEREIKASGVLKNYEIIFDTMSSNWFHEICKAPRSLSEAYKYIERIIVEFSNRIVSENYAGLISTVDHPGNALKIALTDELGLPGPSLASVLTLEHKFASRLSQQALIPEAVPEYRVIESKDVLLEGCSFIFPLIIKPVKGCFSINTYKIDHEMQLNSYLQRAFVSPQFVSSFSYLMDKVGKFPSSAQAVLMERFINGHQVTVNGYVYDKKIYMLGVVDSIMCPGTLSFARFVYPSVLPIVIQKNMETMCARFLSGIDFDNSMFNIECIYDPCTQRSYIIEVNPRIASQFADLFFRVDGIHPYQILCDLAVGKEPSVPKIKGKFSIAASFVLRLFKDAYVERIPHQSDIEKIRLFFPDMVLELFVAEGMRLSEVEQDTTSFRYALIHLGGSDKQDLLDRFNRCIFYLPFKFNVSSA